MLAARARREEVCDLVRGTADPKDPRHCCKGPDMVLTDGEVSFLDATAPQRFRECEKPGCSASARK
eukprot:622047-Lingulodinium_polyedra.AAC.1